jgi:hypothetical protein
VVLGGPAAADAAFTVTNLSDHDPGSLRAALNQANADPDQDQIVFQSGLSGQITLEGTLHITNPVDISGPGPGVITVSGNDLYRPFELDVTGNASISGLKLIDGEGFNGGAVRIDEGHLTLADSQITGSHASGPGGGAIYVTGNVDGNSVKVVRSTVSGNTSAGGGGGITGHVSFDNVDSSASISIEVDSSTISGNHANGGSGGGIWAFAHANGDSCYYPCYGHYPNANVNITIAHSTIAGNSASVSGGGISAQDSQNLYGNAYAGVVIRNTIVADNTANNAANDTDTDGGSIQGDFSLVEKDDAPVNPINETSMIFNKDPQLGPLQDNGGPTPTQALPKTSPAVDKGNKYQATTDQRGQPREADWQDVPNSTARFWDGTDMGAFELQIPPPVPPGEQVFPAECNSTETTKQGTGGNDVIAGTPQRDVIQGLGGNDTIRGLGGNDRLCGGAGKDKLVGAAGKDILFGEAGADNLLGGPGGDFLLGGGGGDKLGGGGGKDSLLGGGGKDKLNGGPGKDLEKQ